MMLLTIQEAARHLRLTETDMLDVDTAASVAIYTQTASAAVLDYIKTPAPAWDAETVPGTIKAAAMLTLGEFFENREAGDIPPGALRLLRMHRKPTLA